MHSMTSCRIQDYGPIRDITLQLTPLHCFIGPRIAQLGAVSEALRLTAERSGFHVCAIWNPDLDVYPIDIAGKIAMLRRASEVQQVLLVTQSPLVVNELKGEEVTLISPDAEGWVVATRLCDTPGYEDAMKVYALGEYWVSYCTGGEEEPLLKGTYRGTTKP